VKKLCLPLIVCLWICGSCASDSNAPKSLINVFLVDAPADYDEVLVEVLGVELEGDGGVVYFPYEQLNKSINISRLVGGERVLVGRGEILSGNLQKIGLKLGDQHSLTIDGEVFQLTERRGEVDLPFDFFYELEAGISYDLYIDFDVQRSIKFVPTAAGNTYDLVPNLRAFTRQGTGDIVGSVLPPDVGKCVVYAIQGFDTVATTATTGAGRFVLNGLLGETSVSVVPLNVAYRDSLFTKVVAPRKNTQVGNITLRRRP
jgi:hypothetical protein